MDLRWINRDEFAAKLAKSVRPLNVGIRKAVAATVEDPGEDRTIKFTLSDGGIDRDKDTVAPQGWDLSNYRKSPVVLWAHDYGQLPIGKATNIEVKGDRLIATAEFTPKDINPLGDTVFQMIKGGYLSGVSVGFKPKEFDYNHERKGVDFRSQELLEFSVVPIPSNPGALAEAKAVGIELLPIRKWAIDALLKLYTLDKGTWTAEAVNNLPDSSFAYIAPGGTKDADGKTTPRSLRHLPFKDADGTVDLPHLRNALSRLDQTDIPEKAKAAARKKLEDAASAHDVGDQGMKAAANNVGGSMQGTGGYGSTTADTHEQGEGDPERDTAGCINGHLCPKMKNQRCPLAEGCPEQKGADVVVAKADKTCPECGTSMPQGADECPKCGHEMKADTKVITTKVGRVLSAKNESAIRDVIAGLQGLLDQLAPKDGDNAKAVAVTADLIAKHVVEREGKFCVVTEDFSKTLGRHDSMEEAVRHLQMVEAHAKAAQTPAEAVEELLFELGEEVADKDVVDLGDLTPDDIASVIKQAVKSTVAEATAADQRRRTGRVD